MAQWIFKSENPIERSGYRFTTVGFQRLDCWQVTYPLQQHSRKLSSRVLLFSTVVFPNL